jgi:DNA-binding NtrC family response regulator
MDETTSKRLKVIIIEDDEDNLNLYNDYLCHKGHYVVNTYQKTDSIMTDIEKDTPDVYLLDYRLLGNENEIDLAIEILNKFPKAPILFITADESLRNEISKHPEFHDKNVEF